MNSTIIFMILAVIISALLVTILCKQFKWPSIPGYLIAGALIGPHALGIVGDVGYIQSFAEVSVVLLLFIVGLTFSFPRLFQSYLIVLTIGIPQVLFSILVTMLFGKLLGVDLLTAFIFGSIAAMSSTIIIQRHFEQTKLLNAYELNAAAILLAQTLAAIPIFMFIPNLAYGPHTSLVISLLWSVVKGVVAILIIFVVGKWLLRPLFTQIIKTQIIELFGLAVLLVLLSGSYLTHLFGLSYALGSLLSGMMLSQTEFKDQISVEIKRFKIILISLFFISVGMLCHVSTWLYHLPAIVLFIAAIVLLKILLVVLFSFIVKIEFTSALRTGLILAEGSELGFAFLIIALNHTVLGAQYTQIIVAGLFISILLSPLLLALSKKPQPEWLPESLSDPTKAGNKKISRAPNKSA